MAGEDEEVSGKAYKIQAMLPWGFDSKLASVLAIIKLPFIFLVAFVGLYAEGHLKEMTEHTWYRYGNGEFFFGTKTGCYAHLLKKEVPEHRLVNFGLIEALNNSVFHGHLAEDVWNSNSTVDLDPLSLGHAMHCQVDAQTCRVRGLGHPGYFSGGIDHLISFSMIWLIYKLVFIGIHPIDRLALQIAGNPPPGPEYPEPLLKLLTEPYFQSCTTPMQVLVKFLFYFRYKMMPNTLLGALASLHSLGPECPRVVYYRMSPMYGNTCYFLSVVDLLSLAGAYAYTKIKMDGHLIGRWRYRMWKTGWLISAAFYAYVSINAAVMTFGGFLQVLQAIFGAFALLIRLDFTLRVNIDLLRAMTFIIFFFEGLELFCLVFVILGPKVAPALFEKFSLKSEADQYEALPDEPTPKPEEQTPKPQEQTPKP